MLELGWGLWRVDMLPELVRNRCSGPSMCGARHVVLVTGSRSVYRPSFVLLLGLFWRYGCVLRTVGSKAHIASTRLVKLA